jgi:hypothetical protein
MAIVNDQPYSDPRYAAARHMCLGLMTPGTANGANQIIGSYHKFTKARLKGMQVFVRVAGTGADSAVDVYVNAGSVANIPLANSTATVGFLADVTISEQTLTTTDTISFKSVTASDVMSISPTLCLVDMYPGA